jgi:hypothetical protein
VHGEFTAAAPDVLWVSDITYVLPGQGKTTVATRRLRGAIALVSEAEHGTVTIRANGRVLPARLYPKDLIMRSSIPARSSSTSISTGVCDWITTQQQARDARRLANPKLSGREKQRIRAGSPPRITTPPPA